MEVPLQYIRTTSSVNATFLVSQCSGVHKYVDVCVCVLPIFRHLQNCRVKMCVVVW